MKNIKESYKSFLINDAKKIIRTIKDHHQESCKMRNGDDDDSCTCIASRVKAWLESAEDLNNRGKYG